MIDRESGDNQSLPEHEQAVIGIAHSKSDGDDLSDPIAVSKALAAVRFLEEVRQSINNLKEPSGKNSSIANVGVSASIPQVGVGSSGSFGPYRLERHIGQGGFADVFLAFDPVLHRSIALKILRPSVVVNTAARIRFEREARAVARLGHPNIVPLYSTGTVGPLMYLAFEYCEGDSLAAWLKRQVTSLDFRIAAKLVIDLADGLEHAHRHGVIHRDLKPSNVMIKAEDATTSIQPPTVMITDFGLASLGVDSLELTADGSVLGTPSYMSPEQANSSEVTTATDIYSLGVIMFELLTGRLPFECETPLATIKAVAESSFPSPTKYRRDIPPDLVAICLKATQSDWRQRYRSAFDFAEDLRCWLDRRPVRARRLNAFQILTQKIRRQPIVSSLILLTSLSVLFGTAIAWWQWTKARASLQQAIQQGQRAERHLAQLSIALDRVLQSIPEPEAITPQQHEMLNDLLNVHQTLLKEEQGNHEVGRDTIRILNRLAQINALLARHQDVIRVFQVFQNELSKTELQRQLLAMDHAPQNREELLEIYIAASQAYNESEQADHAFAALTELEELIAAGPLDANVEYLQWFNFRLAIARGQTNRIAGLYERSIQDHQRAEQLGRGIPPSSQPETAGRQLSRWLILNQSELARSYLANGNYLEAWETQQSVIERRQSLFDQVEQGTNLFQRVKTELARDHLMGVSILSVIGAIPVMQEHLRMATNHLSELLQQSPDSDIVKLELQAAYLWMAHICLLEGDLRGAQTHSRAATQIQFSHLRKLPRHKVQEINAQTMLNSTFYRLNEVSAAAESARSVVVQAEQLFDEQPQNVHAAVALAKAVNLHLSILGKQRDVANYRKTLRKVETKMSQVLDLRLHPQEKSSIAIRWSERKSNWVTLLAEAGEYSEAIKVCHEIHRLQMPSHRGTTRPNVLPATKSLISILTSMKQRQLEATSQYDEIRNQAAKWIAEGIQRGWITSEQWRSHSELVTELVDHPILNSRTGSIPE